MYAKQVIGPHLTAVHVSMSTNVLNSASAGTDVATTRLARSVASACLAFRLVMMEGLVLVRIFSSFVAYSIVVTFQILTLFG